MEEEVPASYREGPARGREGRGRSRGRRGFLDTGRRSAVASEAWRMGEVRTGMRFMAVRRLWLRKVSAE